MPECTAIVVLLAGLVGLGCRAEVDGPASAKVDAPASAKVDAPASPEPDAAPVVKEPQPAPAPEPRQWNWSVPACPLGYHYRADLGNQLGMMVLEFDLVLAAHESGASIHIQAIQVSQSLDGKPWGEGFVEPENSLADVHLELGDGAWREVDGTTRLWTAFQSAVALQFMWPPLPATQTPGATAQWLVVGNHDSPAVTRTEGERGSVEIPDGWEPGPYEAQEPATVTVHLESWDPEAALAVLTVDERTTFAAGGVEDTGKMHQIGRFEVRGDGVLGSAAYTIELQLRADGAKISQAATLTLTNDCAGPVEPSPSPSAKRK